MGDYSTCLLGVLGDGVRGLRMAAAHSRCSAATLCLSPAPGQNKCYSCH